jgi:alkylation response protein AidB-like acyl-CoA dehydrogenase
MAQGAYESALKYSKERKQFGKPIGEFQAIGFKLADLATQIDAARLLTHRAAAMKDAGMKTTLESSMAKLFASEVAVNAANEAVQIHGGYGFIKDYPAEKFYRDVKLCTIGEGTSEIQRLVIARQLLKD